MAQVTASSAHDATGSSLGGKLGSVLSSFWSGMIFLVIRSFFLTSIWIARVIRGGSALVFDWFWCHAKILAALFSFVLIANAL